MRNFFKKLAITTGVLVLGGTFLLPSLALAQTKDDICEGVGITANQSGCTAPADSPTVDSVVQTVINILSVIVGIIAVIMIIIAGLKYITSTGETNNVNSAKNTILYAVIGLVVVVLAQVIVRFVLNKVSQ